MPQVLNGNLLVAQSGGPTTVINSTLAGIITQALNHVEIEEIYGGLNGIQGILNEEFIDLAAESQQNIRGLRHTPGAALGTCRHKITQQQEFDKIISIFEAHNIRYFFYIGGNDSQDTTHKIAQAAKNRGYELRVLGLPKTIDNDLAMTDHCPGYGSVIKYISTTIRELAQDHESMGQQDLVSIVEVMGRNTGWIAAGSVLAKRKNCENDAPHIICLPEVAFSPEKFIEQVQDTLKNNKFCLVVASEGLVDADGNYLSAADTKDAFGHSHLSGVAQYLQTLVEEQLGIKARSLKLGTAQRCASHMASKTDNEEAFLSGQTAVQFAVQGQTDKMITLVRSQTDAYSCQIGTAPLSDVANQVKTVPKHWLNEEGTPNNQFIKYALPLIQGEINIPFENGLPKFYELEQIARVDKILATETAQS